MLFSRSTTINVRVQKQYIHFRSPNRNELMKMKHFLLSLVILLAMMTVGAQAASLNQTIARINADANKPGGPEAVMKSISASTNVPVATLQKEKARSGFNYGDLYAAHAIAKASGKNFDQIAAMKKGQTWDKVAAANNVSLDGKKTAAANNDPAAKPQATPPQKTLRQIQAERYSGQDSSH